QNGSDSVSPTWNPSTSLRPSDATPQAITIACETTLRPTRALQYVASTNTYGYVVSSSLRSRNSATSSSRSPQMRDTSDFEMPLSAPSARTRSSTFLVDT